MHVIIDSSHSDFGQRLSSTCKADPFSPLSYPITQPFLSKAMLQVSGNKPIPYAMSGPARYTYTGIIRSSARLHRDKPTEALQDLAFPSDVDHDDHPCRQGLLFPDH